MSKTTIIPLKSQSATLYLIEDEGVNYDENGNVYEVRRTKPARPAAKKPTIKRRRKHGRRE